MKRRKRVDFGGGSVQSALYVCAAAPPTLVTLDTITFLMNGGCKDTKKGEKNAKFTQDLLKNLEIVSFMTCTVRNYGILKKL